MVDVSTVQYRPILMTETGMQYDLRDFAENLGWEENKKELSQRISFSVKDEKISSLAKPGCIFAVYATAGGTNDEVARGTIRKWTTTSSLSKDTLQCECYDNLYNLQRSNDNMYFQSGLSTDSILQKIFAEYDIPMGDMLFTPVTHGKLKYSNKKISDMILDIMDDTIKKGGVKCILRMVKGKLCIIPYGINKDIYCFTEDNSIVAKHSFDMSGMVTRVKVVGKSGKSDKNSVEAVINGSTEFGVFQKIYTREKDETLADAKSAAQTLIKDNGMPVEDIHIESPDVPFIRKGDMIYAMLSNINGFFFVEGIQHDASSGTMTMQVKKAEG